MYTKPVPSHVHLIHHTISLVAKLHGDAAITVHACMQGSTTHNYNLFHHMYIHLASSQHSNKGGGGVCPHQTINCDLAFLEKKGGGESSFLA